MSESKTTPIARDLIEHRTKLMGLKAILLNEPNGFCKAMNLDHDIKECDRLIEIAIKHSSVSRTLAADTSGFQLTENSTRAPTPCEVTPQEDANA